MVHATKDFFQLACEDVTPTLVPQPFKPFLQGLLNGGSQGFASLRCDLSSESLCFYTLNTKRHNAIVYHNRNTYIHLYRF